ncbi:MAG TPA: hypothetical protein VL832_14545 [Puia sp.]|nr:hypothetical protein [Puia sp.]
MSKTGTSGPVPYVVWFLLYVSGSYLLMGWNGKAGIEYCPEKAATVLRE